MSFWTIFLQSWIGQSAAVKFQRIDCNGSIVFAGQRLLEDQLFVQSKEMIMA
jgi:hypothetical protein